MCPLRNPQITSSLRLALGLWLKLLVLLDVEFRPLPLPLGLWRRLLVLLDFGFRPLPRDCDAHLLELERFDQILPLLQFYFVR